MSAEVVVRFYRIRKCGYYRPRSKEPEFGGIEDTLRQLHSWVNTPGMSLIDTKIFEVTDSSGLDPVYCFDLKHDAQSGTWLLATWNETHSVQGRVATVDGTSPVGRAGATLTDLPAGGIPGYPTYFWFVPNLSVLATVQYKGTRNGHLNMSEYVSQFLAKYTSYVVPGDSGDDEEDFIEGYSPNPGVDEPVEVVPRYESSPEVLPGPIEYIRQNCQRIRKVIRKNRLNWAIAPDRNALLRMLPIGGAAHQAAHAGTVKTRAEIYMRLTHQELDALIEEWQNSVQGTKWADLGFKFENDPTTHWLGRAICKREFEVVTQPDDAGVVDAAALLAELCRQRQNILAVLP